MSRWAEDPVRAGDDLLTRALAGIAPRGEVLLAGTGPGARREVASLGSITVARWDRRLDADTPVATCEPPPGPFETVLLRLPKGRAEVEMTLHQCLGVTRIGGRLVLYGGNDEGIRSAAIQLERIAGEVETIAALGHGRVVAARRSADQVLRPALEDWRSDSVLRIDGADLPWCSYPGLFASGKLDAGTELLIGCLPAYDTAEPSLDFGCGPGAVSAAIRRHAPLARIDMLDADAVALHAASRNVPGATIVAGHSLAAVSGRRYRLIASNPPIHAGIREEHTTLDALVASAPRHLLSGGALLLVVQRRIPLQAMLSRAFTTVTVQAETASFRVWQAM